MKDYLLLYRADFKNMPHGTSEEMNAMTKRWMDWMGGVAAQNKLSDKGNRLNLTGKVVMPDNVVTDGPYTEIKESIGGYSVVKVDSYDEAVEIAKACPVLTIGGNVEIREINPL
jgi:hypothetical protein